MDIAHGAEWGQERAAPEFGWWEAVRRALLLDTARFRPAPAWSARPAVWACVLGGASLGLLWGMVARIWMRLMATHPEFTISGTAMILLFATQFGLFAGLAYAARRRGWRSWRLYAPRALVVPSLLLLGAGQGAVLVGPALLATLAVTQRRWWRAVRAVLALLALAALVAASTLVVSEKPGLVAPLNVALYLGLVYPLVVGLRMGLESRDV